MVKKSENKKSPKYFFQKHFWKIFNKIQYKMGLYYGKSEYLYNNIQLDQVGGTFGFAIPVKRSFARINLMADIGTRGTQADIAIRETYYKFSFGFTLNDQWFIKRKYDWLFIG